MGNLLFSPQGRISSADFMRGGYILVLAAIALGLLHLVNTAIALVLGFLNILLMYAWAVLWIKRLHEGGKSGWMFFCLYRSLYTYFHGGIIDYVDDDWRRRIYANGFG